MIDITKEEFWEADYEVPTRKIVKTSIIKKFVYEHKVISASLICLGICVITNIYLIYSFFKIVKTI